MYDNFCKTLCGALREKLQKSNVIKKLSEFANSGAGYTYSDFYLQQK